MSTKMGPTEVVSSNYSMERTSQKPLRALWPAAQVESSAAHEPQFTAE